jgi:hypothetical protein
MKYVAHERGGDVSPGAKKILNISSLSSSRRTIAGRDEHETASVPKACLPGIKAVDSEPQHTMPMQEGRRRRWGPKMSGRVTELMDSDCKSLASARVGGGFRYFKDS